MNCIGHIMYWTHTYNVLDTQHFDVAFDVSLTFMFNFKMN